MLRNQWSWLNELWLIINWWLTNWSIMLEPRSLNITYAPLKYFKNYFLLQILGSTILWIQCLLRNIHEILPKPEKKKIQTHKIIIINVVLQDLLLTLKQNQREHTGGFTLCTLFSWTVFVVILNQFFFEHIHTLIIHIASILVKIGKFYFKLLKKNALFPTDKSIKN